MKRISVSDAALMGFRVAREQPKVIAIWAVLYLAVQILSAFCMIYMGGEALNQLTALGPNPDPATAMALYGQIAPLYGVLLLIMVPYYTVSMTAAYRVVLRPEESRFGYLRLGADEGRQFVVTLVLGILLFIAYFIAAMITALVVAGVGAGLTAMGLPAAFGTLIAVLAAIPVFLALWAPLAVRLSLAGPQTLATGQIRLFDSWGLTKGYFWPMLGVYVIATVLMVIVTLLGLVISLGATAALGGGMQALQFLINPDMTSVAAYFSPMTILSIVLMSVISAMGLAITLTPPAAIYRDIAAPSSKDLADTFSD